MERSHFMVFSLLALRMFLPNAVSSIFGPSQHDHPLATVVPRRVFADEPRTRLNSEG
jgi:hypothetical protein